jgi:hypothetical protein
VLRSRLPLPALRRRQSQAHDFGRGLHCAAAIEADHGIVAGGGGGVAGDQETGLAASL